ncbi:hypothetical protein [Burkholderia pseudomallei]|uniref:hypothetical protein n=1 Tax=Burkholderia pseudomallei TaxID=28450 RepID=UPI001377F0F2|nr:hypothetical protein [Burkholderia pseudomallei]
MQNATAAHDACRLANRATAVPSAFRASRGAKDPRRIAPLAARPRAAAVAVVFAASARAARARCRRTSNESLSRSRACGSFDIDATRLRAHLPIRIDARDALHRARRGQPLRARIAASIVGRRKPKPSSEHALNARRLPSGLSAASIELATFDAGFDACASVCERVRGEIMDDDSARDVPVCVANRAAR